MAQSYVTGEEFRRVLQHFFPAIGLDFQNLCQTKKRPGGKNPARVGLPDLQFGSIRRFLRIPNPGNPAHPVNGTLPAHEAVGRPERPDRRLPGPGSRTALVVGRAKRRSNVKGHRGFGRLGRRDRVGQSAVGVAGRTEAGQNGALFGDTQVFGSGLDHRLRRGLSGPVHVARPRSRSKIRGQNQAEVRRGIALRSHGHVDRVSRLARGQIEGSGKVVLFAKRNFRFHDGNRGRNEGSTPRSTQSFRIRQIQRSEQVKVSCCS